MRIIAKMHGSGVVLGLMTIAVGAAAVRADEPAESKVVECPGVGWPADYRPAPSFVQFPSARLANRAALIVPEVRLAAPDASTLRAEEAQGDGEIGRERVGFSRALVSPLVGEWHALPDGRQLWIGAVISTDATMIRLHLTDIHLPDDARLYYHAPDEQASAAAPVEGHGPLDDGTFWTAPVFGDTVQLELSLPADAPRTLPFEVDELIHGYRAVMPATDGERAGLTCMLDVHCSPQWPTWEDISYSVGRMSFIDGGSAYFCTGQLLATQNNDLTPYFLTANHCISDQTAANTLTCLWFYQTSSCNGAFAATATSSGADFIQGNSVADYTLLMIRGALPTGVFWSGWTNASISTGVTVHSVSHPQGSWKRYARGTKLSNNVNGYQRVSFNQGMGTIDQGSSGSGIWTDGATPANQLLFGDLSFGFGPTNCDDPSNPVYYGRFEQYYINLQFLLAEGSDDTLEENDSCAAAVPLGSVTYNNLVVKSLDEDWYELDVGSGDTLTVNAQFTHANGNINLELYDACGGNIVATASSSTNNEQLSYLNSGAPHAYFLRVFLASDTRNEYSLTLTGVAVDCNVNGIDDACETDCGLPGCNIPGCGQTPDCNNNQNPDSCDIASHFSADCNNSGVPDECELAGNDCNADLIPDECQLAGNDCNNNSDPDDCDEAALEANISHPADQTPCPAGNASFTATAPGATAYQWYRNGSVALSNGGNISGAQSATLTIDPVGAADEGNYSCVVSVGCISASSTSASLDLTTDNLQVDLTSATPVTKCSSGSALAVFQVAVNDPTGVTYQWDHEGVDLTDGGKISGANAFRLEITSPELVDSGTYTCTVTNACSAQAATASGELLIVPTFAQQPPATQCVEYGSNAVFTAQANDPQPDIFLWYEGATPLSDGGRLSGTSTNTLTLSNVQASDDGRSFALRLAVADPFCSLYSEETVLQAMPIGACPSCPSAGDMDDDGDYDLYDLYRFTQCFGADVSVVTECVCANVDTGNTLVDLNDWAALESLMTGP
ncbi:MAG TPA: hypothetical protein P5572_14625 [Phycisphaerae bacterium]|nr:hypothetical protein [Phycisphaerales bacterium]HRX86252.1 hypothetical protein [Phycisphaerae bacterium]